MTEPSTPGEARRQGLRRSRWVAAGTAVGAAVILTGTIAAVNAAPNNAASNDAASNSIASNTTRVGVGDDGGLQHASRSDDDDRYDDDRYEEDDEYEDARPFTPQQQAPTQQQASAQRLPSRPQTRSGGS